MDERINEQDEVLEILDLIEQLVNTASGLPLTGKVMMDSKYLLSCVEQIRRKLPDDIQQARWVREERESILEEAKSEYTKILTEAKKDADRMVEQDVITQRAKDMALKIYDDADSYSKELRLKTFDYVNNLLVNFNEKMEETKEKFLNALVDDVSNHFDAIENLIQRDLSHIAQLEEKTRNENNGPHEIKVDFDDENR